MLKSHYQFLLVLIFDCLSSTLFFLRIEIIILPTFSGFGLLSHIHYVKKRFTSRWWNLFVLYSAISELSDHKKHRSQAFAIRLELNLNQTYRAWIRVLLLRVHILFRRKKLFKAVSAFINIKKAFNTVENC